MVPKFGRLDFAAIVNEVGYCTAAVTFIRPRPVMRSALAAASDKSIMRPLLNGPRSLTTTTHAAMRFRVSNPQARAKRQGAVRAGEFIRIVKLAGRGRPSIILAVIGGDARNLLCALRASLFARDAAHERQAGRHPHSSRHRSSRLVRTVRSFFWLPASEAANPTTAWNKSYKRGSFRTLLWGCLDAAQSPGRRPLRR